MIRVLGVFLDLEGKNWDLDYDCLCVLMTLFRCNDYLKRTSNANYIFIWILSMGFRILWVEDLGLMSAVNGSGSNLMVIMPGIMQM